MKPRDENFQRPMFDIKVDLDEISLNLNRDQYSDLLDLLEFQDFLSMQSKYIKYHLKKEIEEKSTRKKWKFAYEAIVNEEIRPRFECYKWENIKAHLDRCREYRSIHLQELTGKLTTVQKEHAEVELSVTRLRDASVVQLGIGEEAGRLQFDLHPSKCGDRSEEEEGTRTEKLVGKRLELVGRRQITR